MKKVHLIFVFITLANCSFAQHFELIKKTVLGGEGGWDYLSVDAGKRRLYVSHSTKVEVLNADTHEKIGEVEDLQGVHGAIAIPNSDQGITTNGKTNTATIFDVNSLRTLMELHTGKNPDALLYDNFSKHVFIFNHSDETVTVVDTEFGKIVGTVDVGGTALEAGVSDEQGTIFVNLEDRHEIVSIDAKTLAYKTRWKLTPGEAPTGLAIDRANHRLFSVCNNGLMMVLDSEKGTIITQVPIGKHVDGVVYDPELKVAISSNGEGTITVVKEVSPNEFKVIETVTTAPGARTIALDEKTHHVFVSAAQYGETPAATAKNPNPHPKIIPGTFMVMEFGVK